MVSKKQTSMKAGSVNKSGSLKDKIFGKQGLKESKKIGKL